MRLDWFSWSRIGVHKSGLVALFIFGGCLAAVSIGSIAGTVHGRHSARRSGPLAVAGYEPTSSNTMPNSPTTQASAAPTARSRLAKSYGKLPLSFEANQGQTARQVKYLSRGPGYTLFLTKNEAVLALNKPAPEDQGLGMGHRLLAAGSNASSSIMLLRRPATPDMEQTLDPKAQGEAPATSAVVRMQLVNADPAARIAGAEELPGKANYLVGNNPKKWQTNVPTYARVRYQGIYPGVDLVYYGTQRQLECDFVVAPGTDPGTIRLGIDARNSKVEIAKNDDLVIRLGEDEVRFRKLVVYQPVAPIARRRYVAANPKAQIQNRKLIDGHFVLRPIQHPKSKAQSYEVSFQIASYDHTKPLIIDPTLAYSTYLGGSGGGVDAGNGIAVDSAGSAYVTGQTTSTDFPTTTGAYQTTFAGGVCTDTGESSFCGDAFVTKLNTSGTALVYSTFIGGSSRDQSNGIAVDSTGSAYVTGYTSSTDFPTVNPIQATAATGGNAFVAKLNAAGNGLVYSTYLSGSMQAWGAAVTLDSAGSAYVTGNTNSMDFPTVNPIQGTLGGINDAFVAKLNPAGTALVYSTYLGGSDHDSGMGVAVDSAGHAYIIGTTFSTNFPTASAIQPAMGGGLYDAFVAKLNPAGSALVFSTYLGGNGIEEGHGIAADSAGSAYVTGWTVSTDFPTANAFQVTLNGPEDAFVAKLKSDGSLAYSTYLGGSQSDFGNAIAVDPAGSAYVAGGTGSMDFPTTNAIQVASGGGSDTFLAKLNSVGTALDFFSHCPQHGYFWECLRYGCVRRWSFSHHSRSPPNAGPVHRQLHSLSQRLHSIHPINLLPFGPGGWLHDAGGHEHPLNYSLSGLRRGGLLYFGPVGSGQILRLCGRPDCG
jgi:Beta-propeller repeat